jgi:aminopeptidase N
MEHQNAIAYGDEFDSSPRGFDWLHFHELAHEWWANQLTAPDWRDFWIHESFAEYAEALYAEERARRRGDDPMAAYNAYLDRYFRPRLQNVAPVAPTGPRSTTQMYFLPDGQFNGDIYFKGAMFLHTLRWMLGDEAFMRALRRITYPDPATETSLDCDACRFVTTDDVQAAFEAEAGRDLSGVFAVYLRQPVLPRLEVDEAGGETILRWQYPTHILPAGAEFDVPVEVEVGGRRVRVAMAGGEGMVTVPAGAEVVVDPARWVLRSE